MFRILDYWKLSTFKPTETNCKGAAVLIYRKSSSVEFIVVIDLKYMYTKSTTYVVCRMWGSSWHQCLFKDCLQCIRVGNPKILSPIKFKHLFSNVICASSLISSHLSKGDRLKYLPAVADAEPKRVFLWQFRGNEGWVGGEEEEGKLKE